MAKKKNYVRPDGRITAQVYLGTFDGRRKYKTVYGHTQKEVDEKVAEVRARLRKGLDIAEGSKPFQFFAQQFLATKHTDVGGVYYSGLVGKVNFWIDAIGSLAIDRIRLSDLQPFMDSLAERNPRTGKPTAKKTLVDYRMVASNIFDFAIDNRVIDYNPATHLRISRKAPKSSRDALTAEQQQWILDTPHRAQPIAMIALCTGLRRGEILPLRPCDFDLDAGTVTVSRFVEMVNGKPVLKQDGKTAAATRVIDILGTGLADFLRPIFAQISPLEYICPGRDGKMMTESAFRRMWESYLVDLNAKYGQPLGEHKSKFDPSGIPFSIPHFTLHWLRHTYTTTLYLEGVDVVHACYLLGHSDISTTINIYTHLKSIYGLQQKKISRINERLRVGV